MTIFVGSMQYILPALVSTALIDDSKTLVSSCYVKTWFGNIQICQSTARRSFWILVIIIEIPFSTYFLVTWQV